jgi:hypothetical protein
MQVKYTLRVDPSYCRTVIDRYYGQLPFLLRLPVQFGILGLVIAGWCAWKMNPLTGALVGILVFGIGLLATKAGLLLRFKSRADFGDEVAVTISDSGVEARGNHVQSEWKWAAYPRSVRFSDGILLLRAGVIRWLPDAAIQEGTAEQATSLVGSKSTLRHVA